MRRHTWTTRAGAGAMAGAACALALAGGPLRLHADEAKSSAPSNTMSLLSALPIFTILEKRNTRYPLESLDMMR